MSRYDTEPLSSAVPPPALVPAGLPAAYVGAWAVIGLASMAYLATAASNMTGSPSGEPARPMAAIERSQPPPTESEVEIARLPVSPTPVTPIDGAFAPARPLTTPPSTAAAESDIPTTKYVTTDTIVARAPPQDERPAGPASVAEPQADPVVTGSLMKPPPPPERAPPRPAVRRTALKPAVTPAAETAASWSQTTRQAIADAGPEPAAGFETAVVTPGQNPGGTGAALGILLASGSSVESLRRTWDVLRARHALDFDGLEPRYIVEPNDAVPDRQYALLVGPVASATEIARVCSVLVAEGLMCRTRDFMGNRF